MINIPLLPARFAALLCCSLLALAGCTKNFDKINTNPASITNLSKSDWGRLFAKAEAGIYLQYQGERNRHCDMYAQYFACTSTNFTQDRYVMDVTLLNSGPWNSIYTNIAQLDPIINSADSSSPENALASIWRVFIFHSATDYFGPIPYSSVGTAGPGYAYDAQDKIYDDMFKKLAAAVAVLHNNSSSTPFQAYDAIYKGVAAKWIKFANTLRLRLAIRISDVDPARAKTEGEAAVADGVMTDVIDDALLTRSSASNDQNRLCRITDWNEMRMSATMESYLKGFNDPRLPSYFSPAKATGTYEGLRNGLNNSQRVYQQNGYDYLSNVGFKYLIGQQTVTPQDVMHAAEAWFLRAEGALLGWNMDGTPQDLYEKGIRISMHQWGITDETAIDNYIAGTTTPAAPMDYFNSPPVATAPVKWGGDDELRKEQINTQKWLALYPDGVEAWANVRRSGYPKQYPVINSDNPDLPSGTFIKRLIFTAVERSTNGAAVTQAETLLGGPDKASTPLWWDVK